MYVMLAGFLPFDEPSMPALFRKIVEGEFSYPNWFSQPAKELLGHILLPVATRYNIAAIKRSTWFVAQGYSGVAEEAAVEAEADLLARRIHLEVGTDAAQELEVEEEEEEVEEEEAEAEVEVEEEVPSARGASFVATSTPG